MDIKKNERKGNGESDPENNQTEDKADEGGYRGEVAESFGTEEARKGVLFHGAEAVFFLRVIKIGNLCHHTELGLRSGLLLTAERKGVYAEGGRKVDLVVLLVDGIASGGEIAIVDAFCGGDEVHAGDGR